MRSGLHRAKYLLDGQNVVQEIGPGGRITTLWGPRGPEARVAPEGSALWYVYDAHGNVLAEVDEQGHINPDQYGLDTAIRDFDPWGFVRNPQEVADNGNPLKYCGSLGHPSESNTGLIYMRARYYDPQTGRFISEDPAKDGGNWFAYAGGNPVANVDPDGRVEYTAGGATASMGGAAAAGGGGAGLATAVKNRALEWLADIWVNQLSAAFSTFGARVSPAQVKMGRGFSSIGQRAINVAMGGRQNVVIRVDVRGGHFNVGLANGAKDPHIPFHDIDRLFDAILGP